MHPFPEPVHYWQYNCKKDMILAYSLNHPRNFPSHRAGNLVTEEELEERHARYHASPLELPALHNRASIADKEFYESFHHHSTDYDVFRACWRDDESLEWFYTNIGELPLDPRKIPLARAKELEQKRFAVLQASSSSTSSLGHPALTIQGKPQTSSSTPSKAPPPLPKEIATIPRLSLDPLAHLVKVDAITNDCTGSYWAKEVTPKPDEYPPLLHEESNLRHLHPSKAPLAGYCFETLDPINSFRLKTRKEGFRIGKSFADLNIINKEYPGVSIRWEQVPALIEGKELVLLIWVDIKNENSLNKQKGLLVLEALKEWSSTYDANWQLRMLVTDWWPANRHRFAP